MKARISEAHVRIFRAVEGAVINTAHGHPRWRLTPEMARSIAKRATGTLTAQWPEVLAAQMQPSERADGVGSSIGPNWPPRRRQSRTTKRRPASDHQRRGPLFRLWKRISIEVGVAKRAGDEVRAAALIDVLRIVHEMRQQ